jgi:hypothetical protein
MLEHRARLRCGGQLLTAIVNDYADQDNRTERECAHPFEDAGALRYRFLVDRPARDHGPLWASQLGACVLW